MARVCRTGRHLRQAPAPTTAKPGSCSTIPSETAGPYPGDGTNSNADLKTSQLALPAAACREVYGVVAGYEASVSNFNAMTLSGDDVFGDDSAATQLATVTGSVVAGDAATLVVGVSV